MTDRIPSSFPRRILLAAVGLTPQVVTETLYALAVGSSPRFVPHEIHLITTKEGQHRAALSLLDPSTAVLAQFARDFGLPDVNSALTIGRIHVIKDASGKELSDIGSGHESEAAADCIMSVVRELTSDEDAALHVSIAGGRKTMGFLLGYALSLFGRMQDRLSHVLVDQPFESHPQFFYPPPVRRVLHTREGRPINTADAAIALADIPFVRLRYGLPHEILIGKTSFSEAVALAQKGFAEPELVIDIEKRLVSCHGVLVSLQPLPFAIYAWLARRRIEGRDGDGAIHWTNADPGELIAIYRALPNLPPGAAQEQELRMRNGISSDTLEQNKSRINSELRNALGRACEPYLIQASGHLAGTKYMRIGLTLAREAIRFDPVTASLGEHD
jgi:CRISPR-associated protein (TIGR02584 family)